MYDRYLLVQPVGEDAFRRLDTDAGKEHILFLFGVAVEYPDVGSGIGKGITFGHVPLFVCTVVDSCALLQFRGEGILSAVIGIRSGLQRQHTDFNTIH